MAEEMIALTNATIWWAQEILNFFPRLGIELRQFLLQQESGKLPSDPGSEGKDEEEEEDGVGQMIPKST